MADPGNMEEGLAAHEQGKEKHDGKVLGKKGADGSIEKEEKVDEQQNLDQQPVVVKQKTKRVATLDAFRGLTIVVSAFITLNFRH